jgi:membrane protein DedA with SNARE-associated domain
MELLQYLVRYSYAAMFGAIFLCGVGLPIPEELTLLASGLLVGWQKADFYVATIVCVVAVIAGDSVIFLAGRAFGPGLLEKFVSRRTFRRARLAFTRHRFKAVFFSRFVTGLRIPVYGYAGSTGMSWISFAIIDGLGALVMVPACLAIGVLIARSFAADSDAALARIQQLSDDIRFWLGVGLGVLGIVIVVLLLHRWPKRRIVAMATEEPTAGEALDGAPADSEATEPNRVADPSSPGDDEPRDGSAPDAARAEPGTDGPAPDATSPADPAPSATAESATRATGTTPNSDAATINSEANSPASTRDPAAPPGG